MSNIDSHGKLQISKSQRQLTKRKKFYSELDNEKSNPEINGKNKGNCQTMSIITLNFLNNLEFKSFYENLASQFT